MSQKPAFSLFYTNQEWEALEKQAELIIGFKFPRSGSRGSIPHLRTHILSSINKIGSACQTSQLLPEQRTRLLFDVNDPEIFNALKRLAASKGIDLHTLINRLVIAPLFQDIYTGKGD